MKNSTIAIIVVAIVLLGLAYYKLYYLPQKEEHQRTQNGIQEHEVLGTTGGPVRPSIADLKAKGYDDSEIALIVASESYKNGTGSW